MRRQTAAILVVAAVGWAAAGTNPARSAEPFTTDWIGPVGVEAADYRTPAGEPLPPSPDDGNATARPAESPSPAADDRPRLNLFWDNGAVMESEDKAFRLHVGGRLDFDNTFYHQSSDLPFLLQDGSDVRRARLRADGSIGRNVDFVTEVNFANIQDVTNEDTTTQIGSVGLTDFYVDFHQVPLVQNLRIGHFEQPIGLEHTSSSNDWYYMERSPGNDAFLQSFDYVTGIETYDMWCDDRMTGAVAFIRVGKQTVSPFGFGTGPGEYAVTGRLTGLPFYADDGRRLLHLGLGYSYSGTDNNNFALANRPLVRAGAGSQEVPNILASGTFFTPNPVQIVDAEIAAVAGRFAFSAEYQLVFDSEVFGQLSNGAFSDPRGAVTYQGLYIEMGCFLNADDYRRYDKKAGAWGRQLASCPPGQPHSPWLFADHTPVQLLCRYSYLDLASGNPVLTPSSGAQAGWENDVTAGVDWYVNPNVHFMVNYVYTHLSYVDGTSGSINGLGCRLHLDF